MAKAGDVPRPGGEFLPHGVPQKLVTFRTLTSEGILFRGCRVLQPQAGAFSPVSRLRKKEACINRLPLADNPRQPTADFPVAVTAATRPAEIQDVA